MKKFMTINRIFLLVFFAVLLLAGFLYTYPILNYNFPFTTDQGRDMLDIREIAVSYHPSLIGPTTSINGVYLGPFYYYFNVVPFWIGSGDPTVLVYWNILWYLIAAVLLFYLNYKSNFWFGFFSSLLFLTCNAFFYSARYFWNANPMPYLTVFYFVSLVYLVMRRNIKSGFLAGLLSGLFLQVEAAFAVTFFPFLVVYSLIRRVNFKTILFSGIGFGLTLLPQVVFELRHQFVMTKTFFKEISGESQILGEKISFWDAQISHFLDFANFSDQIITGNIYLSYTLMVIALLFLIYRYKKLLEINKEYFLSAILFVAFAFIFYSWYLHPLKGWYILGLRIPYIIILGLFFAEIIRLKKTILTIGVAGLLIFSVFNMLQMQLKFVPEGSPTSRSGDKSNFRNEIEAIDWVYNKAGGQGFKAYNYMPSVYDYPYQYLYWWYGGKTYGYHPETVTYLDNVPEYIKENSKYYDKARPAGEDPLVFLVYEKDSSAERLNAWLGNFTKYCTLEKQEYTWGTTVEMRKICNE